MPYAMTAAAVSFVTYIVAGFVKNPVVSLLIGIIMMLVVVYLMYVAQKNGVMIGKNISGKEAADK